MPSPANDHYTMQRLIADQEANENPNAGVRFVFDPASIPGWLELEALCDREPRPGITVENFRRLQRRLGSLTGRNIWEFDQLTPLAFVKAYRAAMSEAGPAPTALEGVPSATPATAPRPARPGADATPVSQADSSPPPAPESPAPDPSDREIYRLLTTRADQANESVSTMYHNLFRLCDSAPAPERPVKLGQLQAWVSTRDTLAGIQDQKVQQLRELMFELPLGVIREWPIIRHYCRRLFGVEQVTADSLQALMDWLQAERGFTLPAAHEVSLAEVVRLLRFVPESGQPTAPPPPPVAGPGSAADGVATTPDGPAVQLTAVERAMQIFLRDSNQSVRSIARQVGCDPSLLYRSESFKRLREAYAGRIPKGTKSKDGALEAEDEDER